MALYARLLKSNQVAERNLQFGHADRVGGGLPAGAQDHGNVETVDASALA
jgi:hypothetical protein